MKKCLTLLLALLATLALAPAARADAIAASPGVIALSWAEELLPLLLVLLVAAVTAALLWKLGKKRK